MLGGECGNSAVSIVGIAPGTAVGGNGGGAIVIIVGIRGLALFVSDGLHQRGQVIKAVVGIAHGVGSGTVLFYILHHPVGEVKGTDKLSPQLI